MKLKGQEILTRVRSTYLALNSYADKGTVETVPAIGESTVEFRTYFVRPRKFRFDWRVWHPYFGKSKTPWESSVCYTQDRCYSWNFGITEQTKPQLAIAGATGVSSGAVHKILKLLDPFAIELRYAWYEMKEVEVLDEATVAQTICYQLQGTCRNTNDTMVWVGKDDHLIRKVTERQEISEAEASQIFQLALGQSELKNVPIVNLSGEAGFSLDGFLRQGFTHTYEYSNVSTNEELSDDIFAFTPDVPEFKRTTWN